MIPINCSIPHTMALFFRYALFSLVFVTFSASGYAMSLISDPETVTEPYEPAEWHENANPEKDAALAIENNDLRLLAFALRATSVPGIEPKQVEAYREQCGLRYMTGFGDVIVSAEHLARMKRAREYALHYNSAIITRCHLSE